MKINLVYFSQTENTKKIAEAMAESFTKNGHSVRNIKMEEATVVDLQECDLFGIGTPTFESHAPTPVKMFLKKIPLLNNTKAFVFSTGGGASGNVLYNLTKILRQKKVKVISGFFSLGEIHHPAPCILHKSPNRPNQSDLDKAKSFAFGLLEHIADTSKAIPNSRPDSLKQRYGFYNVVGVIGMLDGVIRMLVPKPKHNQTKCSKCVLCVKECPMNNINMRPYPKLQSSCVRCYRCQNICPSQAFSSNWWYGNSVVLSLWNTFFMGLFGEYEQ